MRVFPEGLKIIGSVTAEGLIEVKGQIDGDLHSRLEVKNSGNFTRFEAAVGVDDSSPDVGRSVEFFVYGDGRPLAKSGPSTLGQPARPIEADVAGVKLIELIVRDDRGKGELPAIVTWGKAALHH